ncbi:MAG: DDE-type integrase/transposase/recombinase [Chloroflexota bacterium]
MYRAIDEDGVVVSELLRDHRDSASAEAFFRQAIQRVGRVPEEVLTDHHQPYVKAVASTCPGAQHIRTGLHRARGETTKAVERSNVPMRDRLRNSRGVKRTETGQRFLEGYAAVRHLRRGRTAGAGHLVRGPALHARVREVVAQPVIIAFCSDWSCAPASHRSQGCRDGCLRPVGAEKECPARRVRHAA